MKVSTKSIDNYFFMHFVRIQLLKLGVVFSLKSINNLFKKSSDLLMQLASWMCLPSTPLLLARSLPAKSPNTILIGLGVSMIISVNMCDREEELFCLVDATFLLVCSLVIKLLKSSILENVFIDNLF